LILHLAVAVYGAGQGDYLLIVGLFVWSSLPYLLGILLACVLKRPIIAFCGMLMPLVLDCFNIYGVFVTSTSSTAVVALLWMPLWNILMIQPVGLAIGWWVAKGPLGTR
jgi:hypothetical protein